MVPKNMIRLSMILSTILLGGVFTSCLDDRIDHAPLPSVGDDATVTFALNVPGTSALHTRGLSEEDETNVEAIDVLLFSGSGSNRVYYDKVSGISINNTPGNTKSFKAMIPIKEYSNYDITVIANGHEQVTAAGLVKGEPKSTALNKLIKTTPIGEKWNSNKIPMWGEALNVNVDASTSLFGNNAIKMTRMISRIDVKLSKFAASGTNEPIPNEEKNANFELVSVRLYNYSTKGTLVPDLENGWDTNNPQATAPNQPAGGYGKALYSNGPLVYLASDQDISASALPDSLIQAIYTLEAPRGSAGTPSTNTCLVVGGKYQGGNETYYRIDFVTKGQQLQEYEYLHLLRNFRYIVNITKISGEGAGTPEEAFHSRPVNIEVEILEWNEAYLSDVVFDGQNYLSVTPGFFEFYRDARESGKNYGDNMLYVKTDYSNEGAGERSGWYVEKIVDAGNRNVTVDWLTLSPQSGAPKQKNERADEVKLIFGENREPEMRSAIVVIAAGRLRYEVEVKQSTIPDIMLNIVDPLTNLPVKELIFNAPVGQNPGRQEFRVDWRPENGDLKVTSEPVIANPFPTGAGAPESGTISGGNNGTGTITYSIQPQGFTAAQVSEDGGDPFLEKSSKVDFTVSNGASYEAKSIFLRQIHYNLLIDYDESYLLDGSTHSLNVRSNAAWRIKSVVEKPYGNAPILDASKRILALKGSDNLRAGAIGGYNITGEVVTFTVPDDRTFWGHIDVTFESADFPKKFEDKTVTLVFALPRVKLMGIATNNDFGYNPALMPRHTSENGGYAHEMLISANNFGLEPRVSTVYSRGFDFVGLTNISEANLKDSLNLNPAKPVTPPDIIVLAYSYTFNATETGYYFDYLKNGGTILALCESNASVARLFNAVFGVTNINTTGGNGSGSIYQLSDVDDMVVKGPFKDLSNLFWGEDASSTTVITNAPLSEIVVYTTGKDFSSTSQSHAEDISGLRHKTYNLVWFGDGGFLSADDAGSSTICPFMLDSATKRPALKNFGTSRKYQVYNSFLFANMVTWAITQTTGNGN